MVTNGENDLPKELNESLAASTESSRPNSVPLSSPIAPTNEGESSIVHGPKHPANEDGRSSSMLIMTNTLPARPPSAASVHSASSSGPRSTTATSRRGGRTRSRSPPMMMSSRPPSTGPQLDSYPPSEDRRPPPPSATNPSAAAAAAAAAAKSMTRNPPPPSSWYDSQDPRAREYRRPRSDAPRYHPRYYEGNPPPPRPQWSPDEQDETTRPPSHNRYMPPRRPAPEEHHGYREGYAPYRYRGARGEPYPPANYEKEYDLRYADPRYDERRQHGPPGTMPPQFDYRPREAPPRSSHRGGDEMYYPHGKEGDTTHPGGAPTSLGQTRVIGGPTPIHVPRAPEAPSRSRAESQSESIFRGRPRSDPPNPSTMGEDMNAQVLLSLRTPSSSFDEKTPKGTLRREEPFSPEAPPQIQHSHQSDSLFDPQRSPKSNIGAPQPSSSIDMAPSFNLFNQSFDSIGDTTNFFNVGGPMETALRSTSFGVGPTSSKDETTELHLTGSVGNFSHQLLGGSTFEMSPNNSFGNVAPVIRNRSGNMMVLGGGDLGSSPSHVLEGYSRSYAATESRSIAAPVLSTSYGQGPIRYRTYAHPEIVDGSPGFYIFLKRHKLAFHDCSFLLPGLKAALLQSTEVKKPATDGTPKRQNTHGDPNPEDVSIARRRVISAVCAFGGTFQGERTPTSQGLQPNKATSGSQSIFRAKSGDTPQGSQNPWTTSEVLSDHRSRHRAKYDEVLPTRYYENDNRLSWEFEETPPIDEMGREEEEAEASDHKHDGDASGRYRANGGNAKDEYDDASRDDGKKTPTGSKDGDQPKMRYRCKLCGQPKQNHTCPYQQSLARSIGVMIYPAVNAFTAAEPGSLAPALAEMNNFISSGDSVASTEGSPSHASRMNPTVPIQQVTPESMRSSPRLTTSTSPMNTPIRSSRLQPSRHSNPRPPMYDLQRQYIGDPGILPSSMSRGTKRGHGQMMMTDGSDQTELLFVTAQELRPEQYRMVTSSKIVSAPDAFTYPALPLPYAQRKRLSDNLFSLSKEVPHLTDECAAVLREAREKDMWDLAVAELMTQVVIVAHCHDTDSQFEGLRRYLMTLGISC